MKSLSLGALAVLASLLPLAGCNHAPVADVTKSFTMKVQVDTGSDDPIPIDFLWVVDNSTSMCQEQRSLTSSFREFTDQLATVFDIDPRIAVTGVDGECDPSVDPTSSGRFNTVIAEPFPPGCYEQRVLPCTQDSDCAQMDCDLQCPLGVGVDGCVCDPDESAWRCDNTSPNPDECTVNGNGTVNTFCVRSCASDQECQTLFGEDTFQCRGGSGLSGCIRPADTDGCPTTFPAVLDGSNLDLFRCAATLGVEQAKCFHYEQGLNAALNALDPDGVNAEHDFLRRDAYLVVTFMSDEDDCSVAPGQVIDIENDRDTCALLPTADAGGPLIPVGHVVNRLKGLKQDPGRVIVAAIAGDSQAEDPAGVAADREAYFEAKGDPKDCHHQSYVCLSSNGKADYGSRYLELTESFGPNGVFSNICDNEGIRPALERIANTILTVLNQVCLPKPVLDEASLTVERHRGDEVVTLTPGSGAGSFRLLPPTDSCAIDGVPMQAVGFGDPPVPGESFTITYQGDPQLD